MLCARERERESLTLRPDVWRLFAVYIVELAVRGDPGECTVQSVSQSEPVGTAVCELVQCVHTHSSTQRTARTALQARIALFC